MSTRQRSRELEEFVPTTVLCFPSVVLRAGWLLLLFLLFLLLLLSVRAGFLLLLLLLLVRAGLYKGGRAKAGYTGIHSLEDLIGKFRLRDFKFSCFESLKVLIDKIILRDFPVLFKSLKVLMDKLRLRDFPVLFESLKVLMDKLSLRYLKFSCFV